jgi:exosortase
MITTPPEGTFDPPMAKKLTAVDSSRASFRQLVCVPTNWRFLAFVVFSIVVAGVFWHSFKELARISAREELYSHLPLIPLVSGYLLFAKRHAILRTSCHWGWLIGGIVLLFGSAISLVPALLHVELNPNDHTSVQVLAAISIWIGGFITLFGVQIFRIVSFPLIFLVFMVPIPGFLLAFIVRLLQEGSTEVANAILTATGVPFVRDGFTFQLPGISIMVAEQCSGIRSSLSLFIAGVLVAHLLLTTGWRRFFLILSVFPITIFKNALRIITLALLAAYWDKRILDSVLHRAGGIPFFALALVFFGGVLWVLRRSEALDEAKR